MPALKRLTERFLPDDVLPFFAEIRSIVRYSADRLSHSRRLFLAIVLMKAVAFGLGVYVVFLSKLALDQGIMAKDMGGFLRFTLLGLLVFAVLKGLLYVSESILEKLRAGFSRKLNSDMTERFLGTDYLSVRTLSSSENSFLVLYDQENIESLVFAELRSLAALVKVPVYFVMAFLISPLLTLVVLLALPFMLFNTLWISGGRKRHRGRELYFTRKHQAALQDVFLNFKLIKSMGKEAWAGNRLTEYFGKKQVKALSKGLFILRVNTLTGLVTKAATALYWVLGGYLMIQKGLSFGSFSAVSIYTGMVLSDISGLGSFLEDLYSERRSIERCASFARDMTGGKNVSRRRSRKVSGSPAGDIVFHDVSFAYPGRGMIIDSASFVLPAGEWSWIRGASGVGKTTMLGMLLRLFPPDRGRITMGGLDVRDIDRRLFYRTVSPVHQDPFILNDTILNNILMGDTVEKSELEHVLEICGVSELVRGFSLGYNTRVGEFGNALSGGQKQRIAIARGLVRRPGVLVLDEATSFIDADSEKAILKAIKDDFSGMTVVLVTHRDSVGEFTDLDLVMRDGTMETEVLK